MLSSVASERLAVLGTVDPDALTAAQHNTDVIDSSLWEEVVFIIQLGTLGTNATVDFDVTSDSASGGSYATTVASATQLTDAGSDSDKQVVVAIQTKDLAAGQRYLRGELTVGTATSDGAVVVLGLKPKFAPASDNDLSTVDEIVNS